MILVLLAILIHTSNSEGSVGFGKLLTLFSHILMATLATSNGNLVERTDCQSTYVVYNFECDMRAWMFSRYSC